jgi:hypothetical protein
MRRSETNKISVLCGNTQQQSVTRNRTAAGVIIRSRPRANLPSRHLRGAINAMDGTLQTPLSIPAIWQRTLKAPIGCVGVGLHTGSASA